MLGAIPPPFEKNEYDGHTLDKVLEQTELLTGKVPKTATVDRGYQGKQFVRTTQINRPKPPLKRDTAYQKRKKRKFFRRRAAIEPIIGHLKLDHRVARNFLKGQIGDSINFIMAASAFNYKKYMVKLKTDFFNLVYSILSEFVQLAFGQSRQSIIHLI